MTSQFITDEIAKEIDGNMQRSIAQLTAIEQRWENEMSKLDARLKSIVNLCNDADFYIKRVYHFLEKSHRTGR